MMIHPLLKEKLFLTLVSETKLLERTKSIAHKNHKHLGHLSVRNQRRIKSLRKQKLTVQEQKEQTKKQLRDLQEMEFQLIEARQIALELYTYEEISIHAWQEMKKKIASITHLITEQRNKITYT